MAEQIEVRNSAEELREMERLYCAHNYDPLDVVIERAEGIWLYDTAGRRYMDCLSAYSAVNQGHCHPRIVAALREQAGKVTLTSRAFRNDQLPVLSKRLAGLCGMEAVLAMNTGAEAVETAIKAARRWGYRRKGIPDGQAEIVVCEHNFHGRTTTIVGFSSEPDYRAGFGPFTPGFVSIPFGDARALERAITPNTCAFLFEPIQCESGVRIPPDGFLREAAEVCRRHNVLLVADEIQTGLGRTGRLFGCDHEGVRPDVYVLGKALSGGVYPVSAVVSSRPILDVFEPGSHGSTYGGNPLACAAALAALDVIEDERLVERSRELGAWLIDAMRTVRSPVVREVRGRGLLVGIELNTPARPYCERLMEAGLLCKETHEMVIRVAPPLIVTGEELGWAVSRLKAALESR